MRDYITVGSTPSDEPCVQVTPGGGYASAMREECQRFIGLIRETVGPEPPGASLRIRWEDHDFGRYAEVAVYYDDTDEVATTYAYRVEAEAPTHWDTPPAPVVTPASLPWY